MKIKFWGARGSIPVCGPQYAKYGGRTFVFLTDNDLNYVYSGGKTIEEYVNFCRGADLLVHDVNYTEYEYSTKSGCGHSICNRVIDLAVKAGVPLIGCFHHSPNHSDSDIDNMVLSGKKRIKELNKSIDCFAVYDGQEVILN